MEFSQFWVQKTFLELRRKPLDVNEGHPETDLDVIAMNRRRSPLYLRKSAFIRLRKACGATGSAVKDRLTFAS